jgi:D-serine deaminase-like pyridoxal phosphate-dependent protein
LGTLVDGLPGLRFEGFMTYPTLAGTGAWLDAAAAAARGRGLEPRWISGGGTPIERWKATEDAPVLTEVRAGTYVYGDRMCIANGSVILEDCALRLRATVVSRPTDHRAIIDSGSKALTSDTNAGLDGWGHVVEFPEARVYALNEEHGYVDIAACGTTNMHDEVVAHRGGNVVAVWRIDARGKLR